LTETQAPLIFGWDNRGKLHFRRYGAQGRASAFIQSISGCFYNVVGLPLACFWSLYHRLVGQSLWAIIPENSDAIDI